MEVKEEPILYQRCLRCGRKLKTLENRMRGMGQTCWEKAQRDKQKKGKLF